MKPEDARRSIGATLGEIEQTQQQLGIVSDPEELSEVKKIIGRIEAKLHKKRLGRTA